MRHDAWSVMLSYSQFWDYLDKYCFCALLATCKQFHSEIPQRMVIHCLFRDRSSRKVDLFRIFPLSVHDVMKLRSPVPFLEAFAIAERKAGGFENCMARVRELGWQCWKTAGVERASFRKAVETALLGASQPVPHLDRVYCATITYLFRRIERIVVWRYRAPTMVSDVMEHYALLDVLHDAVGHWYKGVNADARCVRQAVNKMRIAGEKSRQHVHISHAMLMIGMIELFNNEGV